MDTSVLSTTPEKSEEAADPAVEAEPPTFDLKWMTECGKLVGLDDGTVPVENMALEEAVHLMRMHIINILTSAKRYCVHSRRSALLCEDIDLALGQTGEQQPFGVHQKWNAPVSSGACFGGYEAPQNEIIDLFPIASAAAAKVPARTTLKGHWLVIDGAQPCTHDNPALTGSQPVAIKKNKDSEHDFSRHTDGSTVFSLGSFTHLPSLPANLDVSMIETPTDGITSCSSAGWIPALQAQNSQGQADKNNPNSSQNSNNVDKSVKVLHINHTPMSQKVFYEMSLANVMGTDEVKRTETLHILLTNPGFQPILPRICIFIAEGVRFHISNPNLRSLSHLLRITHSVVLNRANDVTKLLPELIPAVVSCIVCAPLCADPQYEDHWAVRRFAANIAAYICKEYDHGGARARVTRVMGEAWSSQKQRSLASLYGALYTLNLMGAQSMAALCLPHLSTVHERIEKALLKPAGSSERQEAEKLGKLIVKVCADYVVECNPVEVNEPTDYETVFGSFADKVQQLVTEGKLRLRVLPQKQSGSMQPGIRYAQSSSIPRTALLPNQRLQSKAMHSKVRLMPSDASQISPLTRPTTYPVQVRSNPQQFPPFRRLE